MAERQLLLPGDIVKKSNAAARAKWGSGSVWEKRLVAHVAALVRSDDVEFQEYEIPVSKLLRPGDDSGKVHDLIETIAATLMSRVITIRNPRGWAMYNVFSRCVYDRERGILNARFDPDMKEHYLQLRSNFTEYGILEFLMLQSTYSQDIFELLKSWADKPEVTFEIAYLHEQLETPDSFRKDFAAFRRKVLERSHKDIHKKTSLRYEWEPVKKGKAVVAVRFVFKAKKKAASAVAPAEKPAKTAERKAARATFPAPPPPQVQDTLKALGFQASSPLTWDHKNLTKTKLNKAFGVIVQAGGTLGYL